MSDYQSTPQPAPYTGAAVPQRSQTLSILSMVFGILGVLGSLLYGIGFLPGLAGVILGFIARRREPASKPFWLTGIITGFVGIAISVVVVIGVIALFAYAASSGGFSTSP